MHKIFPSQYFFDRNTEKQYVEWMHEKTKWFVLGIGVLISIALFCITAADIYVLGFKQALGLIFYPRIILFSATLLSTFLAFRLHGYKAQYSLFFSNIFFALMATIDTYSWVGEVRVFSPAAQIITVFFFMIVPFLNVQQKIFTGGLVIIGLILCGVILKVSYFSSLLYVLFVYATNIVIYYKFDLLLRMQFKTICEEKFNANSDQLTGIFNRKALQAFFKNDLSAMHEKQTIITGILDIDCFKLYNDTYGHLEGDIVLKEVAQTLKKCSFDRVYRFGGEEFVFTLITDNGDNSDIPDICGMIQNLKISHKASSVAECLTASIGVVILECNDANNMSVKNVSADELLKCADDNLYQAKGLGRNRMIVSNYTW